jgi:hypothetical protein
MRIYSRSLPLFYCGDGELSFVDMWLLKRQTHSFKQGYQAPLEFEQGFYKKVG